MGNESWLNGYIVEKIVGYLMENPRGLAMEGIRSAKSSSLKRDRHCPARHDGRRVDGIYGLEDCLIVVNGG